MAGLTIPPEIIASMPVRFGIRSPQLSGSSGASSQFWALLAQRGVVPAASPATGDPLAQLRGTWPVSGTVTSTYGPRSLLPGETFHSGIDIAVPEGTPVRATGDGTVRFVGNTDGYGLRIEVDHGNGVTTLYAHLSAADVRPGQRVQRGQVIGKSGNTGLSTGPHLHYEIRQNGRTVDPWPLLRAAPTGSAQGIARILALPYGQAIVQAAQRYGLDPALLAAMVKIESGFDPRAVSPAGAKGLLQLMDTTAAMLGVRDPFDPTQNLDGGARYFRQLLERFGGDVALALAAYNAGPGAVERAGGIPPYPETQRYVNAVLATWRALGGTG
ncbi:peptidoglycan DD-metalloendopeptidase family protein [Thermomicrobium sp.]